ncbi:MAG: DUF669 domain-containing protein [bacterium]
MVELEQPVEELESWDPGAGVKVEPGFYEVRIDAVEPKTASSGFPNLNFKFKVVEGTAMGASVYGSRSLHPNALPYFRGFMDLVNTFATGRNIDEEKFIGRYLRVLVIKYDKNDGSGKGVKVDKLFLSEINAAKNDQIDVSASTRAKLVPGKSLQPAQPAGARVGGPGRSGATVHVPAAAGGRRDDDLPF